MASLSWPGRALAALGTLASLWAVWRVHVAGEALLAVTLLVITVLALWTYTSRRTGALRYLFPGVAAALVFVVFPMLYTLGIGFTNYSSTNLLEPQQVRDHLLQEATVAPDTAREAGRADLTRAGGVTAPRARGGAAVLRRRRGAGRHHEGCRSSETEGKEAHGDDVPQGRGSGDR